MQTSVLLSIKPKFANAILDGEKTFELRRKIFRDGAVTRIVLYASSPVQRVVGEFQIKSVLEEEPGELWKLTAGRTGVERNFFDEYFGAREIGYAVEVSSPKRYDNPKPLQEYCGLSRPPQSFCYLNA
jgi:predicted transcriptional regulator